MSSSSSASSSSKRPLKELLNEHQEPFELEDYLLERGYPIKELKLQGGSSSNSSFGCCSTTSTTNFLKKSATISNKHGKRRRNIATSLHKKLLASINQTLRFNDPGNGSEEDTTTDAEKPRNEEDEEEEESGGFLRENSATELDLEYSGSESDVETTSIRSTDTALRQYNSDLNESFSERMNQWRITEEESKQTSPVSVLDEIEALSEYRPVYNVTVKLNSASTTTAQQQQPLTRLHNKVTEDSIFSASLWEQLLQQRKKTQCGNSINDAPIGSSSLCHPKFLNSKKALQQTRQLLLDYVREVVETNGRKQTRHLGEPKFLGPEEIGKIICDNIKAWSKQSVNERKITQLLKSELVGEVEWWNDGFESYGKEIMMEIGDRIFEDVKDEIVQDMITMFMI